MQLEGTDFRASLGRTGMKKRASFEIFVRHLRTTVRKWKLCVSSSNWNLEMFVLGRKENWGIRRKKT